MKKQLITRSLAVKGHSEEHDLVEVLVIFHVVSAAQTPFLATYLSTGLPVTLQHAKLRTLPPVHADMYW